MSFSKYFDILKKRVYVVVMRNMNNLCSLIERRPDAVAMVRGSDAYRRIRGRVLFYGVEDAVAVRVEIEGLPRGRGSCQNPMFAFHIHSGTKCEGNPKDEFADAGMHYNPGNCKHPYHAGDMPPLLGVNGNALSVFLTDRFTIREIIGRVVIIHANPDDFMTQPSGNSGEKIACGVIKRAFR